MSQQPPLDLEHVTHGCAERFLLAFSALRRYITSQAPLHHPYGLSINQIKTLHLIFHRPGISQTTVAERLGVTTASISTSVRELEAHGLVERRPNPDDARVMLLHIAPQGEAIFAKISDEFVQIFTKLLKAVPVDEQIALIERFEAILAANDIPLEANSHLNKCPADTLTC